MLRTPEQDVSRLEKEDGIFGLYGAQYESFLVQRGLVIV